MGEKVKDFGPLADLEILNLLLDGKCSVFLLIFIQSHVFLDTMNLLSRLQAEAMDSQEAMSRRAEGNAELRYIYSFLCSISEQQFTKKHFFWNERAIKSNEKRYGQPNGIYDW